jgi:hypothetical protein
MGHKGVTISTQSIECMFNLNAIQNTGISYEDNLNLVNAQI